MLTVYIREIKESWEASRSGVFAYALTCVIVLNCFEKVSSEVALLVLEGSALLHFNSPRTTVHKARRSRRSVIVLVVTGTASSAERA